MNDRDKTKLEAVLQDADNIIVITEKEGQLHLSFSQHMSELETLDILATVTTRFYEIAEEDLGNTNLH